MTALLLAGCVTQRVDWDSRVGHYTYDQAVTEFGPPDKQARLTDGCVVAEWISRSYDGSTRIIGGGFYGDPGSGVIINEPPMYYENTLQLTFATNNVLAAWVKR